MAEIMYPFRVWELMRDPGYLTPVQYRGIHEMANGDVRDYPDTIKVRYKGDVYTVRASTRIDGKSKFYEDGYLTKIGVKIR